MPHVELDRLSKQFGAVEVIRDLSLAVEAGEFCALLGPSGCGKSTLLRMIAGLETVTSGQVLIGGRDVTRVPPAKRRISMVFQSYALYPHMTVRQNIGFSLDVAGAPKREIAEKSEKVAGLLQLGDYMDRKPAQLSGGQRQRVAIGRALVRDPEVFLFDEPLSNLDAKLRVQMRLELAKLHQELATTMIYVTHDQVEAMTLADRVVVLDRGRIAQVGSPLDLYHRPQNKFVASFIGSPAMNFVPATIRSFEDGRARLSVGGPSDIVARTRLPAPAGRADRARHSPRAYHPDRARRRRLGPRRPHQHARAPRPHDDPLCGDGRGRLGGRGRRRIGRPDRRSGRPRVRQRARPPLRGGRPGALSRPWNGMTSRPGPGTPGSRPGGLEPK